MNDIVMLEEGESMNRDRFKRYLERVRGVNDNDAVGRGESNNEMSSYR
jgi:hypothetical protein